VLGIRPLIRFDNTTTASKTQQEILVRKETGNVTGTYLGEGVQCLPLWSRARQCKVKVKGKRKKRHMTAYRIRSVDAEGVGRVVEDLGRMSRAPGDTADYRPVSDFPLTSSLLCSQPASSARCVFLKISSSVSNRRTEAACDVGQERKALSLERGPNKRQSVGR
jgi:hypothetical protein